MTPIMQKAVKSLSIVLALTLSHPVFAELDVPYPSGVERLFTEQTEDGTLRVPIAPWSQQSSVPHEKRSGTVTVATFELRATSITPAQVAVPIRQALEDAEFQITLDCMSNECGGFDYRVNTPIVSPPNMYMNLRDFLSITGTKGSDQIINILISRIGERIYIQERRVDPAAQAPVATSKITIIAQPTPATNISDQIDQTGAVTLDGLDFTSGSTNLGEGPFSVLSELAGYLLQNPNTKIVLVGHSDAVGGLEGNIAISKQRAEAVRQRLISKYGIQKSRITAQGIAFLSPRASNQTPEGREQNRRVEAVVLQ
jgi:outer membrane protein OmpA-like peptidoglycan-associated protein